MRVALTLFILVASSSVAAERLDSKAIVSRDKSVRDVSLAKLVIKSATLTDDDRAFLTECSADSSLPDEIRVSAISGIRHSAISSLGLAQKPLNVNTTNTLLRLAEDDRNAVELRAHCLVCVLLSLDASDDGVVAEQRMFRLLKQPQPREIRSVILASPRHYRIQKGSATWMTILETLQDTDESEEIKLMLVESLSGMTVAELVSNEEYSTLLHESLKDVSTSDKFRSVVLAKESHVRQFRGEPEVPGWVRTAVMSDFIQRKCSLDYQAELAEIIVEFKTDDVVIVSKAIELLMAPTTPLSTRKACLKIVRSCQVDEQKIEDLIDETVSDRSLPPK